MKTNAIIRIVIWSIVLVFLVGVLVAFVAEERYLNDYTAATSPMVSEIFVPLEPEAAVPSETVVGETPVSVLPNEEKLTLDPKTIDEIEIEWVAGDILILPRDVSEITVTESDVSDERYSMVWKTQNRKLEIKFCEESWKSGLGIHLTDDLSKDLYIYVPQDWQCRSLEIDAASATVEMRNMTIGEMDLDGASGTCNLENCSIRDLDIDTASGDVIFSGTLDTLDFDAASASFVGEFYETPSRIDIDSMSGKLDISFPENCGYTLSMDGMSSRFSSEFQGTTMKNNAHVYGDGRCRIDVDGMNCDVNIRKGDALPTEDVTEAVMDPTEESAP